MTRARLLLTTFLLFANAERVHAQELSGTVLDASDGKPVAFATVMVARKGSGITSNESGQFAIKFDVEKDSLLISCVGYATGRFLARGYKDTFRLQPMQKVLRPIVVGKRLQEALLPTFSGSDYTLTSMGLQTQLGQCLRAPVAGSLLQSVTVGTSISLFEQYHYRFRLRVYDWDTVLNQPGPELTDRDILVSGSTKNKKVELDSLGIILPGRDFMVVVEWLWLAENELHHSQSPVNYRPCIRMKNDVGGVGEAWGYLNGRGWLKVGMGRRKTSAAISAVVRY